MAQTKNKKKRKSRSSDHVHRSTPKHSVKDLMKAIAISGAVITLVAGLFFVEFGGKSIVEHLGDSLNGNETTSESTKPQMDRYTESESEGLDKLIKEKSK
jgi:hypothetical protein